jgi:hypothetical protein
LTDELRSYGAEAEFMRADVRNEDDVRHLVDQTVSRFGRIDSAINNAGTEGKLPRSSRLTVARPLAEAVVEEIHKMGADAVAADLAAADSPHKLTTEIRAIVGERLAIQNIVKDVVHRHIEDAVTLRTPCLLGMTSSLQSLFQQHWGGLNRLVLRSSFRTSPFQPNS